MTTPKKTTTTTTRPPAATALLIELGDANDNGRADLSVRAHILGRVIVDVTRDVDVAIAARVVSGLVAAARRVLLRL